MVQYRKYEKFGLKSALLTIVLLTSPTTNSKTYIMHIWKNMILSNIYMNIEDNVISNLLLDIILFSGFCLPFLILPFTRTLLHVGRNPHLVFGGHICHRRQPSDTPERESTTL